MVCTYTHQNPYSDETKALPDIYWVTQLMFIKAKMLHEWKYFWEPQGELIGSIAEPSVFQEYAKNKKRNESPETADSASQNPDGFDGFNSAVANTHYDPAKGLLDTSGNVVIPKNVFDKDANIGGVAISY